MATLYATVRYLEKQGMHYAAQKVQALDERLADVESDKRLSSDPLTALAAVMREHEINFETVNGITITHPTKGIVFDLDCIGDITPEALEGK